MQLKTELYEAERSYEVKKILYNYSDSGFYEISTVLSNDSFF